MVQQSSMANTPTMAGGSSGLLGRRQKLDSVSSVSLSCLCYRIGTGEPSDVSLV